MLTTGQLNISPNTSTQTNPKQTYQNKQAKVCIRILTQAWCTNHKQIRQDVLLLIHLYGFIR